MSSFLTKRDGWWHFARRVPATLADRDTRVIVRQSTKVRVSDDPRGVKAGRVADRFNDDLETYWRGLARNEDLDARTRYEDARRRAKAFGFEYLTIHEVKELPDREILKRLDVIGDTPGLPDELAAAALLGGEAAPALRLTDLFDEYEAVMRASLKDHSPDQVRKWRNPKKRAIANLLEVLGDKPLSDVTRDNALDFQAWWQGRVLDEDLDIGTANKDIGHLNKMFRTLDRAHRLNLNPVFRDLRIEGEKGKSRSAFEASFVQDHILREGALDQLNDEARRVVYVIVETGLRLSEAVNLSRDTIVLDGPIPHVRVRPHGRVLKTDQSERDIPLVGVALKALRAQPNGFPRYRDKAASLSALVNKVLANARLRPTPAHTLYSIRHTFEDRLTAVSTEEKVMAAMMGHKYSRPRYGAGPSLALKLQCLQKIEFTAPSIV